MASAIEAAPVPIVAEGPVLAGLYDDGVAHLRLNRPAAANGLNLEMLMALEAALLRLHGDRRVRAVLLTGEGRNFCAGGDVHVFLDQGEALPDLIRVATARLQTVAGLLIRLEAPVVAAVQGYAAGGGGLGLVCSSDLVVAGEGASFMAGATRVAMVPDAGVTSSLTQIVGFRRAMEIVLLNEPLTAAAARDLGLINRVVPDDRLLDEALDLARRLARGAPAAQAAAKRLMWSGIGQGIEAVMPVENATQAQLSGLADAREGLRAVIEKRAPRFTGR
ncbi:enoyl-CoA hydratase/isomerase family protein [Zavarzinia compransoris]|uniref:Enoyl-CoA hydratase n=1 Tax=Zavarzinia compransoris TaxID=1264899 RepID=A0A317E6U1_9PROT|nr:enoyl-CoA hydratase-related protein [Zavarzinia compransoris]PWR21990.1 enoyl-CoA hydratase [Zavarzinia compransoris]TDP47271.1 short chain enoyl-CoA hydratase /enoyl-CoA hydratase [Zavarzinia compransoris]